MEQESILPTATVRNLSDKLYEKRKNAALDIERIVKEHQINHSSEKIESLIRVLDLNFAMSSNLHSRKGGLIGLAAIASGLSRADCYSYTGQLVYPVLTCFADPDSRVRYYACEALYNIVKVARTSVLLYFKDVFDNLSKLIADTDNNVKNGADLLDRLLKDVISESSEFDLVAFIPLLRERIYTEHPNARRFIVSWIDMLGAIPDIDMLQYLPELLDGLFVILSDTSVEIRRITEAVLGEFLKEINENPEKVNYLGMVNILIQHSQPKENYSQNDLVLQFTANFWLKTFVMLSGRTMLPFAAGILSTLLPCLAYDDERRKAIRDAALETNLTLINLIRSDDDLDVTRLQSTSPGPVQEATVAASVQREHSAGDLEPPHFVSPLDLQPMMVVFKRYLTTEAMQTRLAILRWILHLHQNTPHRLFLYMEELFPVLIETIKNRSDEVVLLVLVVLAEIASSLAAPIMAPIKAEHVASDALNGTASGTGNESAPSQGPTNIYFNKFMSNLLSLFASDHQFLEDRGAFVIRQLCILMNSEDIYRSFSDILLQEKDTKFAHHMIQTLNGILLTSSELLDLRNQLKDLRTQASRDLFCCLYRSWCHNPVATVSILLLSQNYQPACQLLQLLGSIEVTVDFLTEIDKVVQLIESPIFTFLRLQLLDPNHNFYLIRALYGILMLLPQTDAFFTLQRRLACVPTAQMQMELGGKDPDCWSPKPEARVTQDIDFDALLAHFQAVQDIHLVAKNKQKGGQLETLMQTSRTTFEENT